MGEPSVVHDDKIISHMTVVGILYVLFCLLLQLLIFCFMCLEIHWSAQFH